MAYLYERITGSTLNLHTMPTDALIQLGQETSDQRVKDMVGHILMYERLYYDKNGRAKYRQMPETKETQQDGCHNAGD